MGATTPTPSISATSSLIREGMGEKPSLFSIARSPASCSSIASLSDALTDAEKTPDEDDQRDADHQRRGGRRGALRLALRVLAREASSDAAELLDRRADGAHDRRHEPAAEHRQRDEKENQTAAHLRERGALFLGDEQAESQQRRAPA